MTSFRHKFRNHFFDVVEPASFSMFNARDGSKMEFKPMEKTFIHLLFNSVRNCRRSLTDDIVNELPIKFSNPVWLETTDEVRVPLRILGRDWQERENKKKGSVQVKTELLICPVKEECHVTPDFSSLHYFAPRIHEQCTGTERQLILITAIPEQIIDNDMIDRELDTDSDKNPTRFGCY